MTRGKKKNARPSKVGATTTVVYSRVPTDTIAKGRAIAAAHLKELVAHPIFGRPHVQRVTDSTVVALALHQYVERGGRS